MFLTIIRTPTGEHFASRHQGSEGARDLLTSAGESIFEREGDDVPDLEAQAKTWAEKEGITDILNLHD